MDGQHSKTNEVRPSNLNSKKLKKQNKKKKSKKGTKIGDRLVVARHSDENKEDDGKEGGESLRYPLKNISISLISSKNEIWLTCRVEPLNIRRLKLLVLSGYLTEKQCMEQPLTVSIRGGTGGKLTKWARKIKQISFQLAMVHELPWKCKVYFFSFA